MRYKVEPIVCDYAVYGYHDDKKTLIEIFNSYKNAQLVADILNADLDSKVYEIPNREAEVETMEWIAVSERYKAPDSMYKCSECGEYHYVNDNYCPGCGRKYKPRRRERGIGKVRNNEQAAET